jgi:cytochrome c oxidase subunit 2
VSILAEIQQSALAPAADQARQISGLWWTYFAVLAAVWLLVMAVMLAGCFRSREPATGLRPLELPVREPRVWKVIGAASALTVLILFGLLLSDFFIDCALSSPAPENALKIKLTGHQWWWEARYLGAKSSDEMVTANELHLPLGQPVELELNSTDVIHSFWIPSLHGKRDLIPGHATSTWFTPRQAGEYFGLCAEFCGLQHAHMRLRVVVDPPENFQQWLAHERSDAPSPQTEQARRGQQTFLTTTCALCHSIAGTTARGQVGPDLTHLKNRGWLGAGTLPNQREALANWIHDSQAFKPGNLMPPHPLPRGGDLDALVEYMETLH